MNAIDVKYYRLLKNSFNYTMNVYEESATEQF